MLIFLAILDIFVILRGFYTTSKTALLLFFIGLSLSLNAQGSRLSIQSVGPKKLSICGINDSAFFEVYNISSGTVTGIKIKINLPSGINYVKSSFSGAGISESNISNLNQPEFSATDIGLAKNFKFRILLTADCNLLTFLNNNNIPDIKVRVDYTGNFDLGSSIPFQVSVPSVQFGTITNISYTGDLGSKFIRTINIGNYGKGPLMEVKLKRINGKDIKTYWVNKGNTVFSGDTITTTLNSSFFKTIGNLDSLLDQNETFTLIDSNLIKGCRLLNTGFELSWGCNTKTCQISKSSGSALISNKTPNLVAIPLPITPTCFDKYNYKSEIRFVNMGNMPAISPRVSISLNYPYVMSSFDTASIRIKVGKNGIWKKAVKDSTTNTYNLGYYGCIGLYPIGFFRLKSPDLKPNDTLFVTWDTKSCIAPPCSNASMLLNSWAYHADYKDQCSNTKQVNWAWGKVYDQHYFTSTTFIPTDLVNNQTGEFRVFISAAGMFPRTNNASYIVDLILPPGLVHSKLKKDLYFINADLNASWNPDSVVLIGDTLRGYFPHPVPIILTNSELVFYLKADCSKSGSNGIQNIQLQIRYNPDKNCNPKEWLYLTCQTMTLKIHCLSYCNGGMKNINFAVQRINFGKPDNNNDGLPDTSGNLDTLKIREERCFYGDTIEAIYTGIVKRTSSIITWRNAYIESTLTNGKNLDIVGIQLLVWRRGVTQSVNCSQVLSWKTISGNNATFKIDLSTDSIQSCVSSAFRYSNDDSIIVKVKYRVSSNIGGTTLNILFNNRFYTSNINNPTSNSNKFQCDTFSGQMIMTGYYFTTCCNDIYQATSCNAISVNNFFYLGIGPCCSNYGGNNYFPYEYRNFAKIKSVRYYLPQGYRMKTTQFLQYRTAGSNKTAYEYKDSLQANNNNSYPLVYDVSRYYKDSTGGIINNSDDGFHGYFIAQIEPSCEIQTLGNVPIRYDFIFEKQNTFGTGYDTVSSGNADNIVYNKPVTSIKPSSATIYAAKDTAEWDLVYTNYSSTFSNINTWFAPDNSGAVKIVEIRDASNDTLIPVTNSVFRAGTIPLNQTRRFKVRAIYNSCSKDSIILYSGWNCQGYPKDINSYQCLKERIALYIEPQNTQYQSTITDSITVADLCAQTPYTLTIENTGSTVGYNTRAYVNLPIGMSVVSGSCYMRYPANGSKVNIPLPVLKSGTTYEWDLASISSAIKSGFKGVSDIGKNKITIYFSIKTDCDYSSGNYIRAGGTGNIKCGNPIQSYLAISNPLNIKGVSRPYYTLLKTENDTLMPCVKPGVIKVKIINLGPDKTGIEDKYQVILLPGMVYDSSLYSGQYNSPDNTLTKTRNINGATEVEFSLKDNIQPGDSMYFEFGYQTNNGSLNCGIIDIYSQTAVKQEVVCVADNSKCKINVVTGNDLLKTPISKSNLSFSNLKSSLSNISSDSEYLNLSYTLTNNGSNLNQTKQIVFNYYYDKNASGTVDKYDEKLASDTQFLNLNSKTQTNLTKKIAVKAGSSCALFVSIDSSSCSCLFASARFPIPKLKNAGNSGSICSGDTIQLGIQKVNGFSYLWTPGFELNSDTISNPYAIVNNYDTATIKKEFVLSTYRGQCVSKDTVLAEIFRLPEMQLLQKDTSICAGSTVILKASSRSGTGKHSIVWKPSISIVDSSKFTTSIRPNKSSTIIAYISDSKNCKIKDSLRITVYSVPDARFTFKPGCEGNKLLIKDSSQISNDSIVFYRWKNNVIDTLNTKQFEYDFTGNLSNTLKLEVKSSFGCIDSFRSTIYVNPAPKSTFTLNNVCFGDSAIAINTSTIKSGSINRISWNTSEGKYSGINILKHRYSKSDTFTITLQTTSDKLCVDSIKKQIIIYPLPIASFNIPDVCFGDSSIVFNTSMINGDSIVLNEWNIDGSVYNETSPNVLFSNDSNYSVSLKVSSNHLCVDSVSGKAIVNPNPIALFITDTICFGNYTKVKSLSSISSGSINQWEYNLSDGSSYNTKDFSHRFNIGDTFDIALVVSSNKNCKDTFNTSTVVLPGLNPDFTFTNVCINQAVEIFDNTSFNNTNIQSWLYKFTNTDSSTFKDPIFTYPLPGNYRIIQTVKSVEGCEYDTSKIVRIYPNPIIDFTDSNKCIDNKFAFSSIISIDTGSINSQKWYFGDGDSSIVSNPIHSFPVAGLYDVTLKAESNFGCIDSIVKTIESYPPVIVSFNAQNVCLGHLMYFSDNSSTPRSTIQSYLWDFDDGNTSNVQNPVHRYYFPDTFNVRLQITSAYNCTYDTVKQVVVYPVPTAMFETVPDVGNIVNPNITITDLSSNADSIWYNLGDGSITTLKNLIKAYPDSGVYYIKQYATNKYGCIDSFTKKITIHYMFVFNAPTAFTPNGDGKNDVYAPGGIGIDAYSMFIFNRWGEMVYTTDQSIPWDGTYMGEDVMEGVYAVRFRVKDYKGRWHYMSTTLVLLR